jgi:hypothetical protein
VDISRIDSNEEIGGRVEVLECRRNKDPMNGEGRWNLTLEAELHVQSAITPQALST